ncbi:hypothetical protein [Pseudoxanthomonas sp. Soil82]|uniref:hypothetical protein n=1 Tax=Pseudoxanthomonas sp. Soil82 TaxID=3157341 RepID=UPI00338FCF14
MGDPTPLESHDATALPTMRDCRWMGAAVEQAARGQKKNGRREGARVASVE